MPIYEYRCTQCGHKLEALQKFSDAPLTTCPACHRETLTKLVSAAGFQLKGSGWYQTDFRGGGKAKEADGAKPSGDAKDKGDGKDGGKGQGSGAGDAAGGATTPADTGGKTSGKASDGGAASSSATGTASGTSAS